MASLESVMLFSTRNDFVNALKLNIWTDIQCGMKHSSSQSGVAQMGWKEVLDAKKIFYGAIFCFFSTAGQSRNNDRLRQDAIKGKCLFPDWEILAPNSWAKDQFAEIRVCRNDYFDKKWLEILRYFFLCVPIKLSLSQAAQLGIHFSLKWVLLHLFEGPVFEGMYK